MGELNEVFEEAGIDQKKVNSVIEGNKEEAEEIIKDEKKTKKIIDEALKLCDKLSKLPKIGVVFSDVPVACMMVHDYVKGNYREVPVALIVSVVAALMYLVSPVDIIPDIFPLIGYADDAAVIYFVFCTLHNELEEYSIWKENQIE